MEQELPGGKETLLLVEDERTLRAQTARWLRALGYVVHEAGNGPEALRRMAELGGAVDLVITDWVMPEGMSGTELIRQLRGERPRLKIIVLSGYAPEAASLDEGDAMAVMRIGKPIQPRRLAVLLRECLSSEPEGSRGAGSTREGGPRDAETTGGSRHPA